jgi:L-aminopeptidase/D-esterase-like protein
MTTPADDEAARAQRRRNAIHHVSGITVGCCETGETDCPCVCHDEPSTGSTGG